jgi:Ni,Fe-hydrogenase maturation factor
MANDHRLVNDAAHFTRPGGELILAHIEDKECFERYMAAISKVATIDTADAREKIGRQLLKDPQDYIESCRKELQAHQMPFEVKDIVEFGKRLFEYKAHIRDHTVDLLVMNTKGADQLAMHGLAYPLAVELRSIPILML